MKFSGKKSKKASNNYS